MIKSLLWGASRGGNNGRLSVFFFHRVLSKPDELFPEEPDLCRFNQMMLWIKQWFNVLPLDAAVNQLRDKTLPPRAAAITFDDGYVDNYTNALPILTQHGLCATFFIATSFLNGGRMWNDSAIESIRNTRETQLDLKHLNLGTLAIGSLDEKKMAISQLLAALKYRPLNERAILANQIAEIAGVSLPNNLMMTSAQVIEMRAAGMQIGAHTVSHPILAKTKINTARQEIADSKVLLEELLNEKIDLFAYPNGKAGVDYLPEHANLVKELGFKAAVSTEWGAANADTNLFNIPRFTPWDKSKTRFGLRLVQNLLRS